MMKAAAHGMMIVLAAAFAAGCAAPASSQAASPRTAVANAERRMHCSLKQLDQPTVPLPAGFAAEAAILCAPAAKPVHGRAAFIVRVADRGLAPLITALRRPTVQLPPGTVCPVQVYVLPLFLIDRAGQIIRPVLPVNECGQPQSQFLAALKQVPWVTVHASARS
jgi:hypothetical protein